MIEIDLTNEALFQENKLTLDKPINFIFGKNGTGKSTIRKLIQTQESEKDVRIYSGINSVLSNGKLNAVVLGEENIQAQKNIKLLEQKIFENEKVKYSFEEDIQKWKDEIVKKEQEIKTQSNKIEKFYTNSAKKIKLNELHIASPSYNSPLFKSELKYAFWLTEDEKSRCIEYLKAEEKVANKIKVQSVDFSTILKEVNFILVEKVEEEKDVKRLDSNKKINFAKCGLEIHGKNDICAFCGGKLESEIIEELESFFSASKIKEFEQRIKVKIEELGRIKSEINNININEDNFYIQFYKEIVSYKEELQKIIIEQNKFLSRLQERLQEKLANLFSSSKPEMLNLPVLYDDILEKYNVVVERNNTEDVKRLKEFAKDLIRFNEIKTFLNNFNIQREEEILLSLKSEIDEFEKSVRKLEGEILKEEHSIKLFKAEIQKEIDKTKSETKLASNINKKLNLYVSFELEHLEETSNNMQQGLYKIKNKEPVYNGYREVSTLSEGEKNIIGFLYFIEKLKEQSSLTKEKIIILDDPVDSNDDMLQYIIITEIQELIRQIDKQKNNNVLIIMTHNVHFYINVKYNRLYEDGRDRNGNERLGDRFIHLQKENVFTKVKIIDSEGKDFTTSYESLWKDLRFLYENNKVSLMLNSIRRIIETYMKFNRKQDFYQNNKEAQKLFNVNSHSIDDHGAELNGKNKEQIIELMKQCFKDNDAQNHFKSHWKHSK